MLNVLSRLFETGQIMPLKAGETVFRTGDRVLSMYLVVEGGVDLVRYTATGTSLILNRVRPGYVLAEASAYSAQYHCDGLASTKTQLRSLPVSQFLERLQSSADVARPWAGLLYTFPGPRDRTRSSIPLFICNKRPTGEQLLKYCYSYSR